MCPLRYVADESPSLTNLIATGWLLSILVPARQSTWVTQSLELWTGSTHPRKRHRKNPLQSSFQPGSDCQRRHWRYQMRSGVPRRMLLHGGLSCWKGRRERESEGGIRASKGGYEEKERPRQREDQATAPCERSPNSLGVLRRLQSPTPVWVPRSRALRLPSVRPLSHSSPQLTA